jgi:phage head maturation protease
MEELVVTDAAIDLTRLNAGAPVLESHDSSSTENQVAVVERAWIEQGVGKALVRFPSEKTSEKSDKIFKMVAEGIIRNISVGYRIEKLKIVPPKRDGDMERHIAERWFPFEISFVTVPADAGAQVRSHGQPAPVAIVFEGLAQAAQARMRMRMAGLGTP